MEGYMVCANITAQTLFKALSKILITAMYVIHPFQTNKQALSTIRQMETVEISISSAIMDSNKITSLSTRNTKEIFDKTKNQHHAWMPCRWADVIPVVKTLQIT